MAENTIELKTTNTLTGEIFTTEVNPYDPDSLASCLQDIDAMAKNLKTLYEDVKTIAMDYLDQNDGKPVDVLGGKFTLKKIAGSKKVYSVVTALNYFDQDELIAREVLSIGVGKYEAMLAEKVDNDEMPAGFSDELKRTTDSKAIKPYVKLEKATR